MISKHILDKIYNIYSNILKIKNGKIYNYIYNKAQLKYTNDNGDLCDIIIDVVDYHIYYHFDALYFVNDKIESYFNNKIKFYYYKNNKYLLFTKYKNTPIKSIEYNKNKNICYINIYCNSYEIEYKDKNNKIINLNNRNKNKKFNNKIWYLIKSIIFNDKFLYNFILFKYYLFNNYYIYCLKCHSNKYKYEKIKNYYIFNEYFFIIFI